MARSTAMKKPDSSGLSRSRANPMRSAGFRAKFLERALLEFSANAAASLGTTAAKKRALLSQMREASKRLKFSAEKTRSAGKKRFVADRSATDETNGEFHNIKVELKSKEDALLKASSSAGEAARRATSDRMREARTAALQLVDSLFPQPK